MERTELENLINFRERVNKLGEDFYISKKLLFNITELINDELVQEEYYNI